MRDSDVLIVVDLKQFQMTNTAGGLTIGLDEDPTELGTRTYQVLTT